MAELNNLEALTIASGTLQRVAVKDLEFLRKMPNLRVFGTGETTLRKKYTPAELAELREELPNLRWFSVNGKLI
ncbi:MAG: hypothetical protein FWB91_01185 [Defluviitaleaceae bacterium]|nr:hypothetical protein [Defluviitaleaceae bacterium]